MWPILIVSMTLAFGQTLPNCQTVSASNSLICTKCNSGYSLKNGQCVVPLCPSACSQCTGTGTCTTCWSGYYINTVGSCSPCGQNCPTCTTSSSTCTSCTAPLVLVTNSCCQLGCILCSSGICYKCDNGYWFYQNTCSPCPSNCNQCVLGVCQQWTCGSSCAVCNGGPCAQCVNGYYLLYNVICEACDAGCATCIGAGQCLSCIANSGLNLINGYCCSPKCASCNTKNCWACNSGYFLNNYQCGPCPSGCGTCPNGTCAPQPACPANCNTCDTSGTCTVCNTGYYITGTSCTQCNSLCTSCVWSTTCTGCVSGYNLINDYCCPPKCTSCNFSVCWGCVTGNPVNGVCH